MPENFENIPPKFENFPTILKICNENEPKIFLKF
jgi:hypothetical protein